MTFHLPVVRPRSFAECSFLGATPSARRRSPTDTAEPAAAADGDADDELEAPAEEPGTEGVPCPFVGCADHLVWAALGVADPMSLTEQQLAAVVGQLDAFDLDRLPITCARRGPYSLENVGEVFGVTRERIRQIETKALKKLRHPARSRELAVYCDEGRDVSRPDLVERPGHDAFGTRAIAEAAKRLVPAIAKSFEESSARIRRTNKAPGVKCCVEGCPNMLPRGRRPREGDMRGRCRKHRDELASKDAPRPRALITVGAKTLSKADWARKLGVSETRLQQLEQVSLARGETLAHAIERRLAGVVGQRRVRTANRGELVTFGDEQLTRGQWASRLGISHSRLSALETRALGRGKTLVDVLAERLAVAPATAAEPAPTDSIAVAPAPADDTEDHVHEVTIEEPSPPVADEPVSLPAPAPAQRPTATRTAPTPKRATKRHARRESSVDAIIRDAARGFDAIVRNVERGRR